MRRTLTRSCRGTRDAARALTRRDRRATWLERKVAARLGARLWARENFVFFSLVRVREERLAFVGAFGRWFRVPLLEPRPRA